MSICHNSVFTFGNVNFTLVCNYLVFTFRTTLFVQEMVISDDKMDSCLFRDAGEVT